MATSPNTGNYTLGKGIVYFDKLNSTSGLYEGERDLGNAPEFSYTLAIETLKHFSSRGGLKAKDKEVISQITPSLSFVLDEISVNNLALMNLGTSSTVAAVPQSSVEAEVVVAHLGHRTKLANRGVNYHTLAYIDTAADNVLFVPGELVTGGTSGATALVLAVTGTATTGTLTVAMSSATSFAGAEVITGDVAGVADLAAGVVEVAGTATNPIVWVQDATDTTTYVAGTDYEISSALKDNEIGRIKVLAGGSITDGANIHVTYGYTAAAYEQINAIAETAIEGRLRFVSDNPVGENYEIYYHHVSLTPDGDVSNIGDDWSSLSFSGEVLKDETNHPSKPYYVVNELL